MELNYTVTDKDYMMWVKYQYRHRLSTLFFCIPLVGMGYFFMPDLLSAIVFGSVSSFIYLIIPKTAFISVAEQSAFVEFLNTKIKA